MRSLSEYLMRFCTILSCASRNHSNILSARWPSAAPKSDRIPLNEWLPWTSYIYLKPVTGKSPFPLEKNNYNILDQEGLILHSFLDCKCLLEVKFSAELLNRRATINSGLLMHNPQKILHNCKLIPHIVKFEKNSLKILLGNLDEKRTIFKICKFTRNSQNTDFTAITRPCNISPAHAIFLRYFTKLNINPKNRKSQIGQWTFGHPCFTAKTCQN